MSRQAGDRWQAHDLVFTSVTGTPIDARNIDRRLRKLEDAAGLPRMGMHALRHSCATLLVAQGVPLRVIMELLRHSQMSLTSDLYSHVAPTMLGEVATALDRAFGTG